MLKLTFSMFPFQSNVAPPRRAGRRQRAESSASAYVADVIVSHEPDVQPTMMDSHLACHLIHEWAWGKISATEVQRLSKLSFDDQVSLLTRLGIPTEQASTSLRALAQLGDSGRHSQNIHKQLVTFLGEPSSARVFTCGVPVIVQKPLRLHRPLQTCDCAFLLPHEEFAFMYQHHPIAFRKFMLGTSNVANPDERLHEFWDGVIQREDPRLIDNPVLTRTNFRSRGFHGF